MKEAYSIAVVARKTGLSPDTIRAWERRYQLVEPPRAASGVRMYSELDVVRIELARDATRLGHAIRHVAALSNAQLRRLIKRDAVDHFEIVSNDSADAVITQTMVALRNFDFRAAERSLTAAALVLPNNEFALNVLAPLLRKVGEAWSAGDLEVSQEHALSQLVRNLTGSLALQQSYTENVAEPLVFATPPGEQHEFGIALSALVAARTGFTVANLGLSLPAEEIARAARMLHAPTIVLGSMAPALDLGVPAFLRTLVEATPPRIEVWLGGPNAAALCKKSGKARLRAFSTLEEFAQRLRGIHAGGAS